VLRDTAEDIKQLLDDILRRDAVRVEGVFVLGKELHGLRRTRFMGRWKVQIQLWFTAAVINIKRAVRALSKKEPVAGSQELTNRAYINAMLADAVKEIAGVMHRFLLCLRKYYNAGVCGSC
jgi:hypothetical protein